MLRLALILVAIPVLAGESCLPVSSSRVTPRDLASRLPPFAEAADPALPLAPAPPPGQYRSVSASEMAAWARRSGVSGGTLTPVCLVRQAHRLLNSEIEAAIRPQLPAAALVEPGKVFLEILSCSTDLLPPGHAVFPLASASKPSLLHPRAVFHWRGYWETDDASRVPIWARVSAWRIRTAVRLKCAGQERAAVRAEDLEQVTVTASVFDPAPDESISNYAAQILKRFLPAGSVLDPRQVETPPRVARNSIVDVHVVSGQLHLELTAKAESDGWVGDSVALLIPAGRRRFRAVVQPDGSALLVVNTRQMSSDRRAGE
jgi:flagella basal body P-ring formation protein FlgA